MYKSISFDYCFNISYFIVCLPLRANITYTNSTTH
jgi:hypothetical protein